MAGQATILSIVPGANGSYDVTFDNGVVKSWPSLEALRAVGDDVDGDINVVMNIAITYVLKRDPDLSNPQTWAGRPVVVDLAHNNPIRQLPSGSGTGITARVARN